MTGHSFASGMLSVAVWSSMLVGTRPNVVIPYGDDVGIGDVGV